MKKLNEIAVEVFKKWNNENITIDNLSIEYDCKVELIIELLEQGKKIYWKDKNKNGMEIY